MPKIAYIKKRIHPERLQVINTANSIISRYQSQGYDLTLRQLYYQFIASDQLPDSWIDPVYNLKNGLPADTKNTEKNYKRLGTLIDDGRMCGLIDWKAIVDRTRNIKENPHWTNPSDIIDSCVSSYGIDMWAEQDTRVTVFIEKDALTGIIEDVCVRNDVPFFSCRGFTSQSEMWSAAMRARSHYDKYGQNTIILHLGDHDPSGIDMTRDIKNRFSLFQADCVEVKRIALNMDQIRSLNPPRNPAKNTDSRYRRYFEEYGDDCWELDALEPSYVDKLIQDNIEEIRDPDLWNEAVEDFNKDKECLIKVRDKWDDVVEFTKEEE